MPEQLEFIFGGEVVAEVPELGGRLVRAVVGVAPQNEVRTECDLRAEAFDYYNRDRWVLVDWRFI